MLPLVELGEIYS